MLKQRMQIQEQIKTLKSASIRKNPLSDRRISVPQMDDDFMPSEIDSLALIDMPHTVEEDAAFVAAGLFFSQTFAQSFQIFIHVIVMIKIQDWIEA